LKNIKIISIFYEAPSLKNNKLFDESVVYKYRWLKWAPYIRNELKKINIEVVTSDVAIEKIRNKEVSPLSVGIIQLMADKESQYLLKQGCVPLLLLTFESPVYATEFFTNPSKYLLPFKSVHIFAGLSKHLQKFSGQINILKGYGFFDESEIVTPLDWEKRDMLVFVTSNIYPLSISRKYLSHYSTYPLFFKRLLKLIFSFKFHQIFNNSFISLSNIRYDSIIYFGKRKVLKIYGRGWDNLNHLPYEYRTEINKIYDVLKPESCEDKIKTISKFKFSICYENARYSGYISEKIIECFVAGTIPIYFGAPDILDFIPKNCFIDFSDFNNLDELYLYLQNLDVLDALKYIQNAQNFLKSAEGNKFSFNYFQNTIFKSILSSLDSNKKQSIL
jgi:hypothetical protein